MHTWGPWKLLGLTLLELALSGPTTIIYRQVVCKCSIIYSLLHAASSVLSDKGIKLVMNVPYIGAKVCVFCYGLRFSRN